jgi:hypothetical protein
MDYLVNRWISSICSVLNEFKIIISGVFTLFWYCILIVNYPMFLLSQLSMKQ